MPARRKPQLNHKSVNFGDAFGRFRGELQTREEIILDCLGFYRRFDHLSLTAAREASELLSRIAGLQAMALNIRLDAGFKAPSRLIATLKAILRNPRLALNDAIEPEARGALAAAYQRAEEKPGLHWYDIFGDGFGIEPSEEQVRAAARRAITALRAEAKRGRLVAADIKYLAPRLRDIFLQFNLKIVRKSVVSSHGNGKYFQMEQGSFFAFVNEVLEPLRRFYRELPGDWDVLVPELSAEYITKLAMKKTPPGSDRSAHLSP